MHGGNSWAAVASWQGVNHSWVEEDLELVVSESQSAADAADEGQRGHPASKKATVASDTATLACVCEPTT